MAYKNNIPQSTSKMFESKMELENNFSSYQQSWNQDHYPFDGGDLDALGRHTKLTLPVTAVPVPIANEVILYCKLLATIPTVYKRWNIGGVFSEAMLGGGAANGANWMKLSVNYALMWGSGAVAGVTVFPAGAGIPVFSAAPFIFLTQQTRTLNWSRTSTAINFTIAGPGTFNWVAIGPTT